MIDIYENIYRDVLAISTIKGTKTEKEKFAGAVKTRTIETFIKSNGKAIQAATSHYLGTKFSKMFDIQYETKEMTKNLVYQNSWGFTTRSIGVSVMIHSDDKGLVIPPMVSEYHVVIVPIYKKNKEKELNDFITNKVVNPLKHHDFRVHYDDRLEHRPGYKFNYYEMMGIPIRLDIGMRDVANGTCDLIRRDTLEKFRGEKLENIEVKVFQMLNLIQCNLYDKSKMLLDGSIKKTNNKEVIAFEIKNKNLVLIPICDNVKCEEDFKQYFRDKFDLVIKSLCIPDKEQSNEIECIQCKKKFIGKNILFGRSY
jgi:prolyl-tRNA synthetase